MRNKRTTGVLRIIEIAIFSLIISAASASAQVTIKERVALMPTAPESSHKPKGVGNKLTFSITWTNSAVNVELYAEFGPYGGCKPVVLPGTFNQVTYVLNDPGYFDYGLVPMENCPDGTVCTFDYSIALDGVAVAETTFTATLNWAFGYTAVGPMLRYTYADGYMSSFNLLTSAPSPNPTTMCHGDTRAMRVNPLVACTGPEWFPKTDSVVFNIIQGGQFGWFVRLTDDSVFATGFSCLAAKATDYAYVANGVTPGPSGGLVSLQAQSKGIVKIDSFLVSTGYQVTIAPDTIVYGDTTRISATRCAVIADSQPVTLTIDSSRFGQFINPSGALVSSPIITTWGDVRQGNIKFTANSARDTISLKKLTLTLTDQYYQSYGTQSFYLAHALLTFADKNPRKIWPYIDRGDKGADRPGYKPTRGFTITVKSPAGKPLGSREIKFRTAYLTKTGGHIHATSHDTVVHGANLQGRFWGQGYSGNPLAGLFTDASGTVRIVMLPGSQDRFL